MAHKFAHRKFGLVVAAVAAAGLSACASTHEPAPVARGTNRPYVVGGHRYEPTTGGHYSEVGLASWYSYPAHTRRTANGEWFNPGEIAGAHKTLPIPCIVEVTNLENGRKLKVRINDRGPFVRGRIIDLTRAAADRLGFSGKGMAKVRVKYVGPAQRADSGEILLARADGAVGATGD